MEFNFESYTELVKECEHLEKLIRLKENEIWRLENGIKVDKLRWVGFGQFKIILEEKNPTQDELEKELESLNVKFHESYLQILKEKQVIESMVGALNDPIERTLMRLRYIKGLKWYDVGKAINHHESTMKKFHKRTLKKLEENKARKNERLQMGFNFETYINLTKECEHLVDCISDNQDNLENRKKHLTTKAVVQIEKEFEVLNMKFHESYLQALKEKQAIENAIDSLKDPMERTLMRLRYLEALEYMDICDEFNFHEESVGRIHRRTLKKLEENKARKNERLQMQFNFKTYTNLTKECEHLEKLIASKNDEFGKVRLSLMSLKSNTLKKEVETLNMKFHERYLQTLKEKQAIENAIDSLNDPVERTLMWLRYIEGLEWLDVCKEIHYSPSSVRRICKRALEELKETKKIGVEFWEIYHHAV